MQVSTPLSHRDDGECQGFRPWQNLQAKLWIIFIYCFYRALDHPNNRNDGEIIQTMEKFFFLDARENRANIKL